MDHLPHPKNPKFPPPSIPYLAARFSDLEYDLGDFHSFLKRVGTSEFFPHEATTENFLSDLCVFQSWCFVGFYIEFFRLWDIQVEIKDLVHPVQTSYQSVDNVITTQKLPTYLLRLEAKTRGVLSEEEDEEGAERLIQADQLMVAVEDMLSKLDIESIRKIENKLELKDYPGGLLFERIYLSIAILGEALAVGASFLNFYSRLWNTSPWLGERMLEAGWCRSEVFSLLDQCGSRPSTLYYLGCLDRHSMQRNADHQNCGDDFRCDLENLKLASYKTRHSLDCNNPTCGMIVVDTLDAPLISDMVLGGKVPLVAIHGNSGSEKVQVTDSSALTNSGRGYVCISHVWSDGLGNLHENGIPWCQATRLQRLVNDLFLETERPVPFWLDTLCVPLRRPARDKAIESMRLIYQQATKVLVLDAFIAEVAVRDVDTTELAMRIRTSTWGRRLWTLHEARLAKTVYYQFSDQAVTYDFLKQRADTEFVRIPGELRRPKAPEFAIKARLLSINTVLSSSLIWITSQEHGWDGPDNAHWNLLFLTDGLRYRWTSWLADETICLAGILGQGLSDVLRYENAEDRMCAFFTGFETLPAGMLFVRRHRSRRKGYRWVPLSFLGGSVATGGLSIVERATPTTDGLRVSLPGILLDGSSTLAQHSPDAFTMRHGGECYSVEVLLEIDVTRLSNAELAILLPWDLVWTGDSPPGVEMGESRGVLVTVEECRASTFVAQYEAPVQIERLADALDSSPYRSFTTTACRKTQRWLIK